MSQPLPLELEKKYSTNFLLEQISFRLKKLGFYYSDWCIFPQSTDLCFQENLIGETVISFFKDEWAAVLKHGCFITKKIKNGKFETIWG